LNVLLFSQASGKAGLPLAVPDAYRLLTRTGHLFAVLYDAEFLYLYADQIHREADLRRKK